MCNRATVNGVECNTVGELREALGVPLVFVGSEHDGPEYCLCGVLIEQTCSLNGFAWKDAEFFGDYDITTKPKGTER